MFFCPNAQIIFALTTEVIELGKVFTGRRNFDIRRYNEIAKEILPELGVEINDLWRNSKELLYEAYSNFVHFRTESGIEALESQVMKVLKERCNDVISWTMK